MYSTRCIIFGRINLLIVHKHAVLISKWIEDPGRRDIVYFVSVL